MASAVWLRRVWALGWAEKLFAVALLLALLAGPLGLAAGVRLLVQVAAGLLGLIVLWRLGVRGIRRAIWRLRNRLIVAYLFIAVVPILLLAVLAVGSVWAISGQIAAYLLNVEMERRANSMRQIATSLAGLAPPARAEAVRRAGIVFMDRFPGLEIHTRDRLGIQMHYPEDVEFQAPPEGHGDTAGVLIKDKTFHLWAHTTGRSAEVTVVAPVTRGFLQGLVPQLGEIQLTPISLDPAESRVLEVRLHQPVEGENAATGGGTAVPEPVNTLDFRLRWGVFLSVPEWSQPKALRRIFLGVSTRISGPLKIIFSVETNTDIPVLIAVFTLFAAIFLIVELCSAYAGFSLSRTITSAVHNLYEGTERIKQGDLAHRIKVEGNDQLAELSVSFNDMAENLQRLLAAEKERQRMQAELEIAREVQSQLHPRPLEGLGSLRIASICNAARMVSGDYYDYQPLNESRLVMAIGDVAGKGISAALLMATLQSAMRSQLRQCMELNAGHAISTAKLVSNLNRQLFDSTAPEKYATFFFSVWDEQSSTLTYTNAGHLSPVLIRGGKAIPLDSNGTVVGAFPFSQYAESSLRLEAGDLLVCYTDGITEPENEYGEMYGDERLVDLLLMNSQRDHAEIASLVVEDVGKWTSSSELQDDMTLLVARKV